MKAYKTFRQKPSKAYQDKKAHGKIGPGNRSTATDQKKNIGSRFNALYDNEPTPVPYGEKSQSSKNKETGKELRKKERKEPSTRIDVSKPKNFVKKTTNLSRQGESSTTDKEIQKERDEPTQKTEMKEKATKQGETQVSLNDVSQRPNQQGPSPIFQT